MRVLIDLQHPADLHVFRNVIAKLQAEGHAVKVTGRDKDMLVELATEYGLDVEIFGRARRGVLNLGSELLLRQWRLRRIVKAFRPDVMMAVGGTYVSLVGRLMRVPTYVFYITETATISNMLAYPFATCIYVPQCYLKPIRWRHVRYNGYHELAYLHPRYFTPDPSVLMEAGLQPGETFTIVRFVAWAAVHDIGRSGFTTENKIKAVRQLRRFGKVFISSEAPLPPELEAYRSPIRVSRMHDLLAYASLLFGESASMASEAAILGVPAIYLNPFHLGYVEEEQREYGMVFNFRPDKQDEAIAQAVAILSHYDRQAWKTRARRILDEKVDVTALICEVARERPFWRNRR